MESQSVSDWDPPYLIFELRQFNRPASGNFSNSDRIFKKRGADMTKSKWKAAIWTQMSALGVKDDAYENQVETLAGILEQRDKTFKEFKKAGGKSAVAHTNKNGSTNLAKNPLLVMWDDLNKSALAYWRELGLTPSSYKKITGDTPKKEKPGGLAAALMEIDGD